MAITLDNLLAGARPPQGLLKASATAEGAGTFHSLFRVAGLPGAGGIPPAFSSGSGYTNDSTTVGAIPFTNPPGGQIALLAKLAMSGGTPGTLTVYDRLWSCSGFTTNITTLQSITTPGSLPARDNNGATDGEGVLIFGEVYNAPGATAASWTVTYTNSAGVSGRTSVYAHPANAESVGQMLVFPLANGDVGVRSVESFQCSASSAAAGNVGLTLMRRIASIPFNLSGLGTVAGPAELGLPRIFDDACLALMLHCSTTNTGIFSGELVYSHVTP